MVWEFALITENWQIRTVERRFVGAEQRAFPSESSRSHKTGNPGSGRLHGRAIRACSFRIGTL